MNFDARQTFMDALRQRFYPRLRAEGFKGSGQNLRRVVGPVIQVINIQGSRHGGSCCVNLGIHLQFLPTVLGALPEAKTMDEPSCEFRRRLGRENESDHWWEYGSSEAEAQASAADLISLYFDRGAPFFARWADFPGPFEDVTVEQIARGDVNGLPGHKTQVRAALAMARIHEYLGNADLARSFALLGIANPRPGRLKPDFEKVLSRLGG
jgi:hypothetical protein